MHIICRAGIYWPLGRDCCGSVVLLFCQLFYSIFSYSQSLSCVCVRVCVRVNDRDTKENRGHTLGCYRVIAIILLLPWWAGANPG